MDRVLLHSAVVLASWFFAGCSLIVNDTPPPPLERKQANSFQSPEARKYIDSGALLVDVRSPEEYARGHVEQSINIPFTLIKSSIAKYETDKAQPIVLYCNSGRRAEVARQDLQELGYSLVINGGALAGLMK